MAADHATKMLLVTMPEWGHLSPFLHLATSLQRDWDGSKGALQVSLASMEQVRSRVEACGIDFVSIGTWEGQEAEEYSRAVKASFHPGVPLLEKLRNGSTSIMSMLGLKMGAALIQHLAAAREAGTLPDVLITDGLTSAGFDAAEKFQLPLAVIWPIPLSMCLQLAGYSGHSLAPDVPVEYLHINTAEGAHPIIRNWINPILKRASVTLTNTVFGAGRRHVRQQLGLAPVLMPPVLRNADGSSSGTHNGWKGPMAVQPAVPRTIYLAGLTWEMNATRELPPCWHMVGPLVVDRHSSDFPPTFGPEDAAVQSFLQAASAAGEPVVFTAAGSMTHLTQQQVDALLDTFNTLTTSSSNSNSNSNSNSRSSRSSGPVRVLWALRADSQHLLPAHLQSSTSSSNNKASLPSTGSTDAAAAADQATAAGCADTESSSRKNRIMVTSWVKQTAVLAHPATKIFVTHGGLGSVHECLSLGQAVPLVVPFSNGADHVTIGQQLVNRSLGVMLKASEVVRPGKLLGALEGLLADGEYSRRVAQVAQQWEKAGYGPKMAAGKLAEFAAACKSSR